ncbi:MAG: PDZ domain-containing protein [Bacteroidales bacterium]|nr:PDZ domain-containing protein [Bacteroidales bacterium]
MKAFWKIFGAIALACMVSCGEDPIEPDVPDVPDTPSGPVEEEVEKEEAPITNIENSYESKAVSYRGATITVRFDAAVSWTAALELKDDPEGEWASVNANTVAGEAKKKASVRIAFEKNSSSEERTAELWITPEGFEPVCVATLVQAASGAGADAEINKALNTYMHEILAEDYLFADAYNAQEVDLTVPFTEFLNRHLLSLGDVNIADGGYYRATQSNSGDRFIYTNLTEIVYSGSSSASASTRAMQTGGLGFGPFISTALAENSTQMGIAPAYVRRGSPAEAAGLRRGDIIYAVNGTPLTTSNYKNYMTSLYQNPSGSFVFTFLRFEADASGGYTLNSYDSAKATASSHVYDPVLHASILSDPDNAATKIGYMVYESFDLGSQDILEETIADFAEAGITDLILDLRFNAGGAVAQSRWLSGCIAGEANGSKTFTKVVYNDGKTENWTFDYGYNNDTDPLGKPKSLGLDRLFVICSYNTASAAELVINSLRGIDFPVKLIGCRTEGKNVGMTVSETTYNGRRFQFSPVTFWVRNAKDFGDYPDGIAPDEYVNNDNTLTTDDADNVFPYSFSDWGNMDYNIALQWAYCDITGRPRWTHTPGTRSVMALAPTSCQPMSVGIGMSGNLIYELNKKL